MKCMYIFYKHSFLTVCNGTEKKIPRPRNNEHIITYQFDQKLSLLKKYFLRCIWYTHICKHILKCVMYMVYTWYIPIFMYVYRYENRVPSMFPKCSPPRTPGGHRHHVEPVRPRNVDLGSGAQGGSVPGFQGLFCPLVNIQQTIENCNV